MVQVLFPATKNIDEVVGMLESIESWLRFVRKEVNNG